MNSKYAAFFALVFLSVIFCFAVSLAQRWQVQPNLEDQLSQSCTSIDSEQRIACGKKIALSQADRYSLELISGISNSFSTRILESKAEILGRARSLEEDKKYKALEIVHGIGPKTSEKFGKFIAVE